jgi:hypothetical protein
MSEHGIFYWSRPVRSRISSAFAPDARDKQLQSMLMNSLFRKLRAEMLSINRMKRCRIYFRKT